SRFASGLRLGCVAAFLTLGSGAASAQVVSQMPLGVGGVPGNLLLVPSVEWPTLDSMANLGNYATTRAYIGYFDPDKCYKYSFNILETERYFYPVGVATSRACNYNNAEWSGNYLNWATTQTIDPFRKALTGGYRVRDTTTETWLEKARYDGNGANSIFPNRRVPAGTGSDNNLVRGAVPANWNDVTYRIWTLGNRMRFTRTGNLNTDPVVPYDPLLHATPNAALVYEVSVRVKVCVPTAGIGVEDNCKQYSSAWKPEGLIQKYSERLRYSVFGYLNDGNVLRDGGVLRANQKFVGENKLDPTQGWIANTAREWSPTTGVLVRNPDATAASDTSLRVGLAIADSGVINYVNKFGQMTSQNHKSYDPVSELFYTAIRYLKRQGNVPEYTSLTSTAATNYNQADGFPVITNWEDPIQYRCQKSAMLGIGDANTHRDKNLPGNSVTTDEPTRPATVTADTTVNVVTATQKVASLENITISTPFTGRENSAYMAGLAYDAHTKDLRSDFTGMQTVSTYWVDVRENQVLEGRARNQYWLAAKYGGFTVPQNFDPYAATATVDAASWSSGETLSTGDLRPRNFYVASEADKMVESLSRAFARIANETVGSGTALASNSTRLEEETSTFQAQFNSGTWSGELQAFAVLSNGTLAATPRWRATTGLNATTWSTRRIYVNNPQAAVGSRYNQFLWANLGSLQTAALGTQQVVDYLRGDRTMEEDRGNGGLLRTRTEVLGDIVNSTPVYVGKPNSRLYVASSFTGASAYATFAANQDSRTPVVYVGANDGMLHGFNAATGAEVYAFVPNASILGGLRTYTDPAYDHRYFVDGEVAVADVYDTAVSAWKTILVGTMGRGGPGIFALDVTNPSSVQFLWEKSGTDITVLGKNIGRPVIAQVANGDWRVLLGNGPGTTAGSAHLISINIRTGTVTTADTGATGSNGLTAVLPRDNNGDGFADTAYAGDIRGNLWKFTSLSGTPTATKMFEARDPSNAVQPITAAPLAGKDPATGIVWVFVGTGRYLGSTDPNDRQVQTWYGVKDSGTGTATRANLMQRDILAEGVINSIGVRVIEEGTTAEIDSRRGWFMDLISPVRGSQGERMVVQNRFQGQALIGTTRIPDATDACQPAGSGFVMAINPFTGARLDLTFYDVTRDGEFTNPDMLMVNGQLTVVSGVGFESGPSNPLFIENMMQVGLDDGTTETIETQGSAAEAGRMSWRELVN
ncbi:MAG: PilC/PilY family type IV pilus protein, partial [Steroidobacter sp.]